MLTPWSGTRCRLKSNSFGAARLPFPAGVGKGGGTLPPGPLAYHGPMKSEAETVDAYLASLPPPRRELVVALRDTIVAHLPEGYEETMQYGMIAYVVPRRRYPLTYNDQPLAYIALASQKHYVSVYLMGIYSDAEAETKLQQGFAEAGVKLDRGKSCVRFRKLEDVPFDVLAESVAGVGVDDFIERYEASRR